MTQSAHDDQFITAEQATGCSVAADPTQARTGHTAAEQAMYWRGFEEAQANAQHNAKVRPIPTGATGEEQDDSIALDKLADYIADNWPDKKYGLEEICQRLHAMWPGEFISLEDLSKNLPNVREALRALLIHWKRFQKSDGNQQDAYNLMVKGARHAWQFAEVEINRVPVGAPAAGDALDAARYRLAVSDCILVLRGDAALGRAEWDGKLDELAKTKGAK